MRDHARPRGPAARIEPGRPGLVSDDA
jgi:hypothetical protein